MWCLSEEFVIFISKLFYSMRFAKREFADRMIEKKNMLAYFKRNTETTYAYKSAIV